MDKELSSQQINQPENNSCHEDQVSQQPTETVFVLGRCVCRRTGQEKVLGFEDDFVTSDNVIAHFVWDPNEPEFGTAVHDDRDSLSLVASSSFLEKNVRTNLHICNCRPPNR